MLNASEYARTTPKKKTAVAEEDEMRNSQEDLDMVVRRIEKGSRVGELGKPRS